MDPFKKSLLLHGIFMPLIVCIVLISGVLVAHNEVERGFTIKKRLYDDMTQQDEILQQALPQRQILSAELPKLRTYFQSRSMTQATARIASQCSDDKGLKLGDLKENPTSTPSKSISHQLKLSGRSAPLIEIIGETQSQYPALQMDQWSISAQADQKILSFQGNLSLVTVP